MLALTTIVAAGIGGAVPSFRGQQPGGMLRCGASPTLEGTPYPDDTGNFLCKRITKPFPLPCKSPREDYAPQKEFVITAWWPPSIEELDLYAEANFNTMIAGSWSSPTCWNTTDPYNQTWSRNDYFECQVKAIKAAAKLGLKSVFYVGAFPNQLSSALRDHEDIAFGGDKSFGGIFTGRTDSLGSKSNYSYTDTVLITAPEADWILTQLKDRNLLEHITHFFLQDDLQAPMNDNIALIKELKSKWNQLTPLSDSLSFAGEIWHEARAPVFAPEEYYITGLGNEDDQMMGMIKSFLQNQYMAGRYGLDPWPLLYMNNQNAGSGPSVTSDSLVRFQIYAALAFGSKGVYIYCWGLGVVNIPEHHDPQGHPWRLPGTPSVIYPFVKDANADARVWGNMLIHTRFAASITTGPCTIAPLTSGFGPGEGRQCVRPNDAKPIVSMSDRLTAGLFLLNETHGYMMLFDQRLSNTAGAIPERPIELVAHPDCELTLIPAGRSRPPWKIKRDSASGQIATIWLEGGEGALLAVRGSQCMDLIGGVRPWWNAPAGLSLATTAEGISVDIDTVVPVSAIQYSSGGGSVGPEGASGNSVDPSIRYKHPGQVAPGNESPGDSIWASFMIGGAPDITSDGAAKNCADAGFNTAAVPVAGAESALEFGRLYGIMVLLNNISTPTAVERASSMYSCHPSMAGVLLDPDAPPSDLGRIAKVHRQVGYWQMCVAPQLKNISAALELAEVGVPLSTITAAKDPATYGTLGDYASAVVATYMGIQASTGLAPYPMSAGASVDACWSESDSVLRFTAYSSLVFGTQALWWENMATCAPIGSAKFALIGAINSRIAQWGNTFQNGYVVERWFTTATDVSIPNAQVPGGPGSNASTDLVQSMDSDLLVAVLRRVSTSAAPQISGPAIFVISTRLSIHPGGAPVRNVNIELRGDVRAVQPMEGNCFEGNCACSMCKLGWKFQLSLPGGSSQLVGYALFAPPPPGAAPNGTESTH